MFLKKYLIDSYPTVNFKFGLTYDNLLTSLLYGCKNIQEEITECNNWELKFGTCHLKTDTKNNFMKTLAFARMLGWDTFIPHWNKFKELQDLPQFGEIRYTFNHSRGMRFSTRDDVNERYVLVVEGLAKKTRRVAPDYTSHPYKAVGWLWGYECVNDDWRYNETTWYAPLDNLRPMESLIHAKSAS